MKLFLKIISILLLLFNGIGALYGSWHFITDPTGVSLHIPVSYLQHSPFNDFFIPGIILLLANGVLSFVAIALVIFKNKFYPWAIIAEGCILFGWISIQAIMLMSITDLHIIFWLVAFFLIVSSFLLNLTKIRMN